MNNDREGRYRGDRAFARFSSGISRQRNACITWFTLLAGFFCLATGWYLILSHSLWSLPGVLLLAEGMLLAAYLRHECAHLLAFKTRKHNMILAEILSWITGDLQSSFAEYRRAHLRHHAEHVDLVGSDLMDLFQRYPAWVRAVILTSEAFYIPGVFMLVRGTDIAANLRTATGRLRALGAIGVFVAAVMLTAAVSPISLVLYLSAIVIRIHCIRFADAFQHSYDRVAGDVRTMQRGRIYEQQNTFSFPVSRRYRFMNLLLLNFGFHNAHHAVPNCPWYHLPKLNRALRRHGQDAGLFDQILSGQEAVGFAQLLRSYHRNRLRRILDSEKSVPIAAEDDFLTAALRGTFTDNLLG